MSFMGFVCFFHVASSKSPILRTPAVLPPAKRLAPWIPHGPRPAWTQHAAAPRRDRRWVWTRHGAETPRALRRRDDGVVLQGRVSVWTRRGGDRVRGGWGMMRGKGLGARWRWCQLEVWGIVVGDDVVKSESFVVTFLGWLTGPFKSKVTCN